MPFILYTTRSLPLTAQDLRTMSQIGTSFTAAKDGHVKISVNLSNSNSGSATAEFECRKYASNGTTLIGRQDYSAIQKIDNADSVICSPVMQVFMRSGQILKIYCKVTNLTTPDSSITVDMDLVDGDWIQVETIADGAIKGATHDGTTSKPLTVTPVIASDIPNDYAKPGDPMTLTEAYDAAMTAVQATDLVDLSTSDQVQSILTALGNLNVDVNLDPIINALEQLALDLAEKPLLSDIQGILPTEISGPNVKEHEYIVTDSHGDPVEGVYVIATSDLAGTIRYSSGSTDIIGRVILKALPGPTYFWSTKLGLNFTNPDMEVVS